MTRGPLQAGLALVAALAVLWGCSAGAEPKTRLVETGVPLGEPSWVPGERVLVAVSEDGRHVVRVDLGSTETRVLTRELYDAGENLAVDPEAPGRAYLGRPGAGEISALDTEDLRIVGGQEVGGSPYHVALDAQSEVVFALSWDGKLVASAELKGGEEIPAVPVAGRRGTLLEAPEKGLEPAFWTADASGVSYYHGDPPRRLVGKDVPATDVAVDSTSAQRVYVADGDRVVALEGDPQNYLKGRLVAVAERDLGAPVERVASHELHVFAATEDRLVAMRRESLEVEETVDFGPLLEERGVKSKGISGVAVGSEDVYVALEGAPYVLSIRKP